MCAARAPRATLTVRLPGTAGRKGRLALGPQHEYPLPGVSENDAPHEAHSLALRAPTPTDDARSGAWRLQHRHRPSHSHRRSNGQPQAQPHATGTLLGIATNRNSAGTAPPPTPQSGTQPHDVLMLQRCAPLCSEQCGIAPLHEHCVPSAAAPGRWWRIAAFPIKKIFQSKFFFQSNFFSNQNFFPNQKKFSNQNFFLIKIFFLIKKFFLIKRTALRIPGQQFGAIFSLHE